LRRIALFLTVTLIWSWGCWGPAALGWVTWPASALLHVIGTLGPALGAIVCWWRSGDRWLSVLRRGCAWRPNLWPWLLTVLAVPCALVVVGLVYARVVEGLVPNPLAQRHAEFPWLSLPAYAAMSIVFFGFGEEIGWRGWLLPQLQARGSAARATVWVALVWALWHLPLFMFLDTMQAMSMALKAGWLLNLLLAAAMMTWLFNATDGSIGLLALLHGLIDVAFLASGSQAVMTAVGVGLTGLAVASIFYRGRGGTWLSPWGRLATAPAAA